MMQKIYLILTLIMMGLKVAMFKIDEEFEIRNLVFTCLGKRNLTNLYRDLTTEIYFRPRMIQII